ncbi:flagellar brake domain-containing protein [Neobacillus sp. OS1-32]|uniref:Flagellar brake domain-containing protein n=1 Tax=Neobacillus paridis TaxID=2803862 RepID=A0ABS1TNN8_9BACI|nr:MULTISPECIES: flagellar brake protein [Neobacillus]MBL4952940.1 flagellar brake domain-containing protein [Neobacillus paridis]WML31538.1 flagellar brake domain-containing protein [Neobacillus sp. OS1-32]
MYPKVNQKIVIEIPDKDLICHSMVAEVSDDEILISQPMDQDPVGLFPEGTSIAVSFTVDDNKYQFKTKILGRKRERISLFRITKPQENQIQKIQLRENFRVETTIRLKIDEMELHTINISAGGLLFSCTFEMDLKEGEELSGTIFIPDSSPISFKGVIKRIRVLENNVKHVAMQFTVLDRKDESKIVQFCFQKQRQMRMKR